MKLQYLIINLFAFIIPFRIKIPPFLSSNALQLSQSNFSFDPRRKSETIWTSSWFLLWPKNYQFRTHNSIHIYHPAAPRTPDLCIFKSRPSFTYRSTFRTHKLENIKYWNHCCAAIRFPIRFENYMKLCLIICNYRVLFIISIVTSLFKISIWDLLSFARIEGDYITYELLLCTFES